MAISLLWFRRDLRLADNPALVAATSGGTEVVPVFVHDDALVGPSGANRVAYLHATLDALDESLGGALVERTGDPTRVIAQLADEVGAEEVHVAADFGPYGSRRDDAVAEALAESGRRLVRTGSPYAVAPGTLRNKSDTPFKVFTPFSKAWRAHGWPGPIDAPATDHVRWSPQLVAGERRQRPATPEPEATAGLPSAGERAAWEAAEAFLHQRVDAYRDERDRPDLDATSRLSPHLKWGTIHPRQLLAQLDERQDGHRTFANELAWREFYADVLHHRPDTVSRNFVDTLDGLRWDTGSEADARFEAWCQGRTGYPIVDAGMRQLLAEGWMHNRVRMIVASFLVKDLHIDWRSGAAWFMRHLIDGDLASNTHGWQWTAGTGTDAAPFFRVFNPTLQGERHDPDGDYVRRYVPELAGVAGGAVHRPPVGTGHLFAAEVGDYPAPIVDHAVERDEALARYAAR